MGVGAVFAAFELFGFGMVDRSELQRTFDEVDEDHSGYVEFAEVRVCACTARARALRSKGRLAQLLCCSLAPSPWLRC